MNRFDEHDLEHAQDPSQISSQQQRFVYEHLTCAMCETELEILHEVDVRNLKIKEQAHCPCCGIRVRSTHHLMH